MNIYILAKNYSTFKVLQTTFKLYREIKVINLDFLTFMENYPDVECIVSPANSYGMMDGGYDAAISDYLGWDFQKKVQDYIKENYYGEQIVGTSFILKAPKNKKLIHTPTMIIPSTINDKLIVYTSMRSTLICALQNNIKSIVIPPFGMGTGGVSDIDGAELMLDAYKQIKNAQKGKYYYFNLDKYYPE